MEKIKAVCVDNTYWKDSVIEGPFIIGKIYDLSPTADIEWCWVVNDYDRMGHYPSKMFKPLDQVRNENLDLILG
jgi:hypothetical protein